jgi:hypothetical protein
MSSAESGSSRRLYAFVGSVLAAIVAGIVLVFLVPSFEQPDLVATWALTSDQPGTTKIVLDVHNDGDRTVTGCEGNWRIVDKATDQTLASFDSDTFDVPSHGAAVPVFESESKPTILVSNDHLPPTRQAPVNIILDITCGDYHTELVYPTNW